MANPQLFASARQAAVLPTAINAQGVRAYALAPKHALAQLAVTGCFNSTFYAAGHDQLSEMLALCFEVGGEYVAKTALFARQRGYMKDAPAVLCAWLASFDGESLEKVFDRVIDNGKMLRNFVQILRSGAVARNSLGSRPKRLVQRWLEQASDERLIAAMVGQSPSLADVIKMVHPKAATPEREALFGYIIGRNVPIERLPQAIQGFERFKKDPKAPLPEVPFQMLTSLELTTAHWTQIAKTMSWTSLRMNLNTLARHGVFKDESMLRSVAKRLADKNLVRKARAFPYQLLAANTAAGVMSAKLSGALEKALEHATANVPKVRGSVAVAVDVSGSMQSPVTGHRQGGTTAVRCVDVAGLVAACVLANNPGAMVLPFNDSVQSWQWKNKGVWSTAKALADLLGGGTNITAPLVELERRDLAPDLVIIVSDNQSWLDASQSGSTRALRQWNVLKERNPQAKLVCIDLQPYTNSQLPEQKDVLNIGGFSDQVFEMIAAFAEGKMQKGHWVQRIEEMQL